MITGFKGRSVSLEKIVKVSRDQLIRQAWSKYDPEMTVVKAKSLRLKSAEEQSWGENISEEHKIEETSSTSPHQKTTFILPDNTQKIDEIITLVQTHQGDQEINISNKTFFLNEEGIEKIHALLTKYSQLPK
jgi:hypothetical protein